MEEKNKGKKTIIREDFNARRSRGEWEDMVEGEGGKKTGGRMAKDRKINGKGKKLVEFINKKGG